MLALDYSTGWGRDKAKERGGYENPPYELRPAGTSPVEDIAQAGSRLVEEGAGLAGDVHLADERACAQGAHKQKYDNQERAPVAREQLPSPSQDSQ